MIYDILDSNNMYQMLSYDSLTKLQKLSIKSTEALLNTCFYRSKCLYINKYYDLIYIKPF